MEVDTQARERILQAAEAVLIKDELPIVPLYFYAGCNYFDPNTIDGIYLNIRDEHPIRAIRKRK